MAKNVRSTGYTPTGVLVLFYAGKRWRFCKAIRIDLTRPSISYASAIALELEASSLAYAGVTTMTTLQQAPPRQTLPPITWQKLPDEYLLPDDPVESILQPLLAAALRESLELAGLILDSMIIATNFGICATVGGKTVVKAPDWVYVPTAKPLPSGTIRRSYTPHAEGELPAIVMEFISATEGGEYSINPHYPYGKWYFYEQILKIPVYAIFHPEPGTLGVYALVDGQYQEQSPDANGRFWIDALSLFLGVWQGKKAEIDGCWLRFWDQTDQLLLWGSERIQQEQQLTDQERQRADQEHQRAEQERQRADQLALKLRELGVDIDSAENLNS
jgi:Uma2 family endonuclease